MFAVRYVALAALVLWLGGTVIVLGGPFVANLPGRFHLVAAACGMVVFTCLFVMKFVGPPPHAFAARAAIVFVMLGLTLYAGLRQPSSTALLGINAVLGLVLLYWYATE